MNPIPDDIPDPLRPPIEPPPVDVYVSLSGGEVSRIAAHSGNRTVITRDANWGAVAVDRVGNVFVPGIRGDDRAIYKIPAGGGAPAKVATTETFDLAADFVGNVYAFDDGAHELVKIRPNGAPPTGVWSSQQHVWRIAVDASENVYIGVPGAVPPSFSVVQIPADGGQPAITDMSGIFPTYYGDWTIDPQGQNLYVCWGEVPQQTSPGLVKVPMNGNPRTNFNIDTGGVLGLAADAAGNVYIADFLNDRVDMVTASGRQVTLCHVIEPTAIAIPPTSRQTTIPIPLRRSRLPELIGKMFGGAAVDGGGWIVIGNTVIPIPPRSPVMTTLVGVAMRFVDRAIEAPELAEQLRDLNQRGLR